VRAPPRQPTHTSPSLNPSPHVLRSEANISEAIDSEGSLIRIIEREGRFVSWYSPMTPDGPDPIGPETPQCSLFILGGLVVLQMLLDVLFRRPSLSSSHPV
jgi:hypothetical protein